MIVKVEVQLSECWLDVGCTAKERGCELLLRHAQSLTRNKHEALWYNWQLDASYDLFAESCRLANSRMSIQGHAQ